MGFLAYNSACLQLKQGVGKLYGVYTVRKAQCVITIKKRHLQPVWSTDCAEYNAFLQLKNALEAYMECRLCAEYSPFLRLEKVLAICMEYRLCAKYSAFCNEKRHWHPVWSTGCAQGRV